MKKLIALFIFAFIIQLHNGDKIPIPGAVGFVILEIENIPCHGFYDKDGKPLLAIPSILIKGGQHFMDNLVM